MEFVNLVRGAQGCEPLESLPIRGEASHGPLELAMGCRLEAGLMRFGSPAAAQAVAQATGLPVGAGRVTIAVPAALDSRATPTVVNTPRLGWDVADQGAQSERAPHVSEAGRRAAASQSAA